MKRGQIVAVCHDGKWGRRVKGEVVATRQGHHIKVRFPHPDTGAPLEFWARVKATIHHQRNKHGSCIYYHNRYKSFGGWIDNIDYWCPWFAVYKWKDEETVTLDQIAAEINEALGSLVENPNP